MTATEHEIFVNVPVQNVWATLTDPAHRQRWYGAGELTVEVEEPMRTFAFRSGSGLVGFTLQIGPGGTRVLLRETERSPRDWDAALAEISEVAQSLS
ncbi:hypothetical protein G5C51_21550 [Streptomyces sp. A7024]|uniref:Polyketide cyclase n=1 Tax=Streptomyces coryli TaxID=1128680 RepID=A0A6G4U2T7_9ACTN|nr:hypothetical protein [Streptomyces coryli]NGN66474.1 hypothetical protein [Streptomyces coryli]